MEEAQDPLIGATLAGRYRILERLGKGGMSTVYLAKHVLIDRLNAIKILRRNLCDDPVQRDRFLREARAVNRINHENIVEITDYGDSEDGRVFLVMEYIPGESLLSRIERGAMEPIAALDVALQMASGLARAHQMGVVHRDLKPDNVLLVRDLDGNDRVKILDFGIAKLLDMPSLTASDKVFGTPGYIAPEYAAGAPIDGRADLYSLGVVLYEMVTAELPFDVEFQSDLLLKHMYDPPIPPRSRRPDLPVAVEALILRALEKDPTNRYRDAHHMIEELTRVREELGGPPPPRRATSSPAMRAPVPTRLVSSGELSSPSFVPPSAQVGSGTSGASAWARYLLALRDELDRAYDGGSPPSALESHLARMHHLCDTMTDRTERIKHQKTRLLALESRGREFRGSIGRALDELGSELSQRARERDEIAAGREALEARRDGLAATVRGGDRAAQGEADALLWQIAASDEVLRDAVRACEDVEFQLRELSQQLQRLSEALEADQNALVREITEALESLAHDDEALRALAQALPR